MEESDRHPSRRREARDAATAPERLRELARQGCGREVAANPNTPADLLLTLAARHFEAFLGNPVLPLLLLEDPAFCLKIPASALRRLLRRLDLPANFLATLRRHPDPEVRDGAIWHVAADDEERAAEAPLAARRRIAALPPVRDLLAVFAVLGALPEWLLEPLLGARDPGLRRALLEALAASPDPAARDLLAWAERTGLAPAVVGVWTRPAATLSAEDFARLERGGPLARRRAAEHGSAPPELLVRLVRDASAPTRRAALLHRALPVQHLWAFAGHADERSRAAVALNPAAPAELLAQLAADRRPEVRAAVARARFTPPDTLAQLSGDAEKQVRTALSKHRWLPVAALERLATDADARIRRRVAAHRCTPVAVVEQLLHDPDQYVRSAARGGNVSFAAILAELARSRDFLEGFETPGHDIAQRHDLPKARGYAMYRVDRTIEDYRAVLGTWRPRPPRPYRAPEPFPPWRPRARGGAIRSDYETQARRRLAETIEDGQRLAELANDPDIYVRIAVGRNAQAPLEVAARLARDPDAEVRKGLICYGKPRPELVELLLADPDPEVRQNLLIWTELEHAQFYELEKIATTEERLRMSYKKNAPSDLLRRWAADPNPKLRAQVARHANTPPDILEKLADDADLHVAAMLGWNEKAPAEIVAHVARRTHDLTHLHTLIHHREAPAEVARQLLASPDPEWRAAAAAHPSLPLAEALAGSADPAPMVRGALCSRGDLPEPLFRALAAEFAGNHWRLAALAANLLAPADLRAQWAAHPDSRIRCAVACNPATGDALLRQLAADPEVYKTVAARRPPPAWLPAAPPPEPPAPPRPHPLADQPAYRPVPVTEENLRLAREGGWEACHDLLHSQVLPRELQELLVQNPDRHVRERASWQRNLPDDLVRKLALDSEAGVRMSVIGHSAIAGELLRALLFDRLPPRDGFPNVVWMRRRGLANPHVTAALRREIASAEVERVVRRDYDSYSDAADEEFCLRELAADPAIPAATFDPLLPVATPALLLLLLQRADRPAAWRERALEQILAAGLASPSQLGRLAALAQPRAPQEALAASVRAGRWLERYAVARNPATAPALRTALAQDAHALVRAATREKSPTAS